MEIPIKIKKNYKDKAGSIYYVLMAVWFGILYVNSFSPLIWFLIILNIAGVIFYRSFYVSAQSGVAIKRCDIKEGVEFQLEKILGPGNERFYFIYDSDQKFLYSDDSGFESGWHIKNKDGELVRLKDYKPPIRSVSEW